MQKQSMQIKTQQNYFLLKNDFKAPFTDQIKSVKKHKCHSAMTVTKNRRNDDALFTHFKGKGKICQKRKCRNFVLNGVATTKKGKRNIEKCKK